MRRPDVTSDQRAPASATEAARVACLREPP